MRRALVSTFVLLTALAGATGAVAQGFDCRNVRMPDEKLICSNPELGQLDEQLTRTFNHEYDRISRQEQQALDADEDDWLAERHRCGANYDCVVRKYRERMSELSAPSDADDQDAGQGEPAARATRKHGAKKSPRHVVERPAVPTPEHAASTEPAAPAASPEPSIETRHHAGKPASHLVTGRERHAPEPAATNPPPTVETEAVEHEAVKPKSASRKPEHHATPRRNAEAAAPPQAASPPAPAPATPPTPEPQQSGSSGPVKPTINWVNPPPSR